ncbi:MAG TPA: hypothetical protein VK625_08160 [Flavitalea sp.]|nr:hypothetical protein [Flavitalea sp.]
MDKLNNDHSRSSVILENEILLMKLNAEFGARVFLPEHRVAPEIENHFLKTVYAFEQSAAAGRNREIIFNRLGAPDFPDEASLNEEQVSQYLNQVLEKLYAHKIVLDTLTKYPDRILYRFITTEFFHVEVDAPEEADCYFHFCYEDYYPNHDFDLRQASQYFTTYVMDQIRVVPQNGLYTRVRTSSGLMIGFKEAVRIIEASCAEFLTRSLLKFEITKVDIMDEVAIVDFHIGYEVTVDANEKLLISGEGNFEFIFSDDIWWISYLRFPGVVI